MLYLMVVLLDCTLLIEYLDKSVFGLRTQIVSWYSWFIDFELYCHVHGSGHKDCERLKSRNSHVIGVLKPSD